MRTRIALLGLTAMVTVAACKDGGGPAKPGLSGEYKLVNVAGQTPPYRLEGPFLDGSYIMFMSSNLRVLSRGRLSVGGTWEHRTREGALRELLADTVVFSYRRSGDIVELRFEDPVEVQYDTLDVITYFDVPALSARSMRYVRSGALAPLRAGAIYVPEQ